MQRANVSIIHLFCIVTKNRIVNTGWHKNSEFDWSTKLTLKISTFAWRAIISSTSEKLVTEHR